MHKYSFVFLDGVVRSFDGRLTYDDDNYIVRTSSGLTYTVPRLNVRFYSTN